MKFRFLLVTLIGFALNFGCTENKADSTISAIQKLCECENSQGKTIDELSKEFLGSGIYSNSSNAVSFSDAIEKLDPSVYNAWFDAISRNFIADEKYMKCAKSNVPLVKQNLKNEGQKILIFLDQSKYYAIYRVLPFLIQAVEDSKSK